MTTLASPVDTSVSARAVAAQFTDVALVLDLADGRSLSAPLAWYPRLLAGTAAERAHLELICDGEGIHWPDLDEDLSVESILAGRASAESLESFRRWLVARAA